MSVLLSCDASADDVGALLDRIESEFTVLGIADPPAREELRERVRSALGDGAALTDAAIVEGRPPVPEKQGSIEWAEDFFDTGFAVDERTGAVDYWQSVAKLVVREGQLLATVTPPQQGEDGVDVLGRPVPVAKAEPASMAAGENVRREESDGVARFYAAANGRLRWASGVLAVDSVLEIAGSVGIETGHITHPGAVCIKGDVRAGSRIQADGDVEVKGAVEAADMKCGGSLTVGGGITGSEGRVVVVNGSVRAKFINEAHVEVGEDVIVQSEIMHSIVKCRGRLSCPSGRLVGGETVALGGVEIGQVSAEGGMARTPVIAGEDFSLVRERANQEKQIAGSRQRLRKIHSTVDPMMAMEKGLTHKQREAATELLAMAMEMDMSIEEAQKQMEELEEDSIARAKYEIVVNRKAEVEAVLCMKGAELHVKEPVRGPVRAVWVDQKIEWQPSR